MLFGQVNFVIGGGAAMTTGSVKKSSAGLGRAAGNQPQWRRVGE